MRFRVVKTWDFGVWDLGVCSLGRSHVSKSLRCYQPLGLVQLCLGCIFAILLEDSTQVVKIELGLA